MNKIIIVYDNIMNPEISTLLPGWGFSLHIEWDGKRILFDAGWDGNRLISNLNTLKLPYDYFDAVYISHMHWDHAGGIPQVLNHSKVEHLYLPAGFSENQTNEIKKFGPTIHTTKGFQPLTEISTNIYSTGSFKEKGPINEQALVLQEYVDGKPYNRLIVGCSHPGLECFYYASKSLGTLDEIIGGLHGFKNIDFILENKTKKLSVGHCTQHKSLYSMNHSIEYQDLHVGLQLR